MDLTRRLLWLALVLVMPCSMLAAPGVGIGPETLYTQTLKTNTTKSGWQKALSISTNITDIGTNVSFQGNANISGSYLTLGNTNRYTDTGTALQRNAVDVGSQLNSLNVTNTLTAGAVVIGTNHVSATQFRGSSSGLTVTIESGQLVWADGSQSTFTGGTVVVPTNCTSYLMIDFYDLTLHAFRRGIHSGALLVGTVVANASAVTSLVQPATFVVPPNPVEEFKQKLLHATGPLTVLVLGDSLSVGTATNYWSGILFGSTSASGLQVSNVSRITLNNASVGGISAKHAMVSIADVFESKPAGGLPQTATHRTLWTASQATDGKPYKGSPFLTATPDLVIIGYANACDYPEQWLETAVREYVSAGASVIIHTSNIHSNAYNFDAWTTNRLIADIHGAALADTTSFVGEAWDHGINTYTDSVHQDYNGHLLWSRAMRSILNDHPQLDGVRSRTRRPRVTLPNDAVAITNHFANWSMVSFAAAYTSSTSNSAAKTTLSLPVVMGRKAAPTAIITMAPPNIAYFNIQACLAADLIVENAAGEDCTYTLSGNAVIRTNTITGDGNAYQVLEGLNMLDVANATASGRWPVWQPKPICLTITIQSGIMRLAGVMFYCLKPTDVPWSIWDRHGTWGYDTLPNDSAVKGPYTDTGADFVSIPFTGNALEVIFHMQKAAGIINTYLDGVAVDVNKDLYVNSGTAIGYYGFYSPNTPAQMMSGNFGNHVFMATLTSTNGAAIAPTTSEHRLFIYGARAIDAR